jgi:hypothetical protein
MYLKNEFLFILRTGVCTLVTYTVYVNFYFLDYSIINVFDLKYEPNILIIE